MKLLAVLFFQWMYNAINGACTEQWIQREGICYFVSKGTKSWYNANATCTKHEAGLASIRNQGINDFLTSRLQSGSTYWLGLTRATPSLGSSLNNKRNDWVWEDGSNYTWYNWGNNQPDGNTSHGRISPSGYWSDWDGGTEISFICQKFEDEVGSTATSEEGTDTPTSNEEDEVGSTTTPEQGTDTPTSLSNEGSAVCIGIGVGVAAFVTVAVVIVICILVKIRQTLRDHLDFPSDMKSVHNTGGTADVGSKTEKTIDAIDPVVHTYEDVELVSGHCILSSAQNPPGSHTVVSENSSGGDTLSLYAEVDEPNEKINQQTVSAADDVSDPARDGGEQGGDDRSAEDEETVIVDNTVYG